MSKKSKTTKLTKQQIIRQHQEDILEFNVRDDIDLMPVWTPGRYAEALGIFNMLGIKPVAYQMGHRFFWPRKRAYFYVHTPELLEAVKPLVGRVLLWMPTIDEMIINAMSNGITVSFYHTRKIKFQHYTVMIYDTHFPELGTVELMRFSSMDLYFCVAHSIARALRRRMEFVGLETIKPIIYLDDPEYSRITARMIDQRPLQVPSIAPEKIEESE